MKLLRAFLVACLAAMIWAEKTPADEPTTAPTSQPIPRAQLEILYQQELRDLYQPAMYDRLYIAHQLIERAFTQPSTELRKEIVKSLEQTGIAPGILGRITRIRLFWPEAKPGIHYVNEQFGPHEVKYFVAIPQGYQRTKAWPLVLKLPTAHAFTTDPPPDGDQVAKIYVEWLKAELADHPDAICIMPLLNFSELWGPSYPGMNCAIQPMMHAANWLNVDPTRVYMSGHSMSGHATWNLALHYTTYFAAVNPMAGGAKAGWQRLRLPNMRNVVPVVWHDADDKVIPVEESREIVGILKKFKYPVEFDETKGVGHAPSAEIANRLYAKMREYRRSLYPTHVDIQSNRQDTLFNRNDWIQMYQPMNPGEDQRLRFQYGSGVMKVYRNIFSLNADRTKGNRIELTSKNVESMRIYLNDQMVDFGKPITIAVNTKVRFEGMVKQSIDEMLKDQVFLGRGWRYYTGIVDIDFGEILKPATRPATTRSVIEIMPPEGSNEPPTRIVK